MIRARLIGELSSKFESFSRSWNVTSSEQKTLANLIDRLIQDEAEIKNRSQTGDKQTNSAFYTNNKHKNKNGNPKSNDKCNNCGKYGH